MVRHPYRKRKAKSGTAASPVPLRDAATLASVQEALQRSEVYLRELFMLSPEGILVTDAQGCCIDVNPACCQMLGLARDEVIGANFKDLVDRRQHPRIPPQVLQLKTAELKAEVWKLRHKSGLSLRMEVRAQALSDGRHVGFLRDITAQDTAPDGGP